MNDNQWHRSIEEHQQAIMARLVRCPATHVALDEALGRVLAQDVVAGINVPQAAVSAMDGFAVRHADVVVGAVLPVTMDIPAGSVATAPLAPGCAARIMTGAPLPAGADSVVAVELTNIPRGPVPLPAEIRIDQAIPFADAVRDAGSDVAVGELVAAAGTRIDAFVVGALAAVGVGVVEAVELPRVRVVATGAELRQPGDELAAGQIFDSNSHTLAALVHQLGLPCERVAVQHDSTAELEALLPTLLADVEVLIFSGGVSAGAFEVVRQTLVQRGVEFGTVAMQPGKPQGFGIVDDVAVFCLPGNPVSTVVSFEAFVRPWLEAAAGRDARAAQRVVITDSWSKKPGRAQLMPVVIGVDGTASRRTQHGSQSHLATKLVGVDGFAHVPADLSEVRPGDVLDVMMVP